MTPPQKFEWLGELLGLPHIGHSTLHRNTDPKFINITINAPHTHPALVWLVSIK